MLVISLQEMGAVVEMKLPQLQAALSRLSSCGLFYWSRLLLRLLPSLDHITVPCQATALLVFIRHMLSCIILDTTTTALPSTLPSPVIPTPLI
jgi:hypothetical protein